MNTFCLLVPPLLDQDNFSFKVDELLVVKVGDFAGGSDTQIYFFNIMLDLANSSHLLIQGKATPL